MSGDGGRWRRVVSEEPRRYDESVDLPAPPEVVDG